MEYLKEVAYCKDEPTVEFKPGIWKTTLAYNDDVMVCHFKMAAGSDLPLHSHKAVQNGYIISGTIEFFKADGTKIVVGPGDGYVFSSMEEHGSHAPEDVEFIEAFSPVRPEYIVEN